jgi:hypothetical protein
VQSAPFLCWPCGPRQTAAAFQAVMLQSVCIVIDDDCAWLDDCILVWCHQYAEDQQHVVGCKTAWHLSTCGNGAHMHTWDGVVWAVYRRSRDRAIRVPSCMIGWCVYCCTLTCVCGSLSCLGCMQIHTGNVCSCRVLKGGCGSS